MVIGNNDNHKDHNLAFTTLLHTARKCNVKLNYDKLKFKCTEVNFYGETYMTNGYKPAQNNIAAIVEMPPPSTKKEVQSFIGMVKYLTKFSPRLTELSEPIRELIKEKVPFNWGPEHQESFDMLKKGISESTCTCLLQSQKRDCAPDGCQHQGPRSLSPTR